MLSFSTCWNNARHSDGEAIIEEILNLGVDAIELSHGMTVTKLPGIRRAFEGGGFRCSGVHNYFPSPTEVMIDALRATGTTIDLDDGGSRLVVDGGLTHTDFDGEPTSLYVANSGTSIRFLTAALSAVGDELQAGKREFEALEKMAAERLEAAGFKLDYVAIRRANNLAEPDRDCDDLVVLAAAYLGKARLIDNVVVTI